MAIIKSGAGSDLWTIDSVSKAGRITAYNSLGREVAPNSKATFSASGTFTPAATPTDLVTIFGSGTKTVRIIKIEIGTTNTAAGSQQFLVVKRSAVNTGGTFVAATAVSKDTTDGASATATVGHYTANPSALGTSAGTVITKRLASPAAVPASFAGVVVDAGHDFANDSPSNTPGKQMTLSGTNQGYAVNFNGAALVAGQTHFYNVEWTEE
jgi:hypothetical protein